MVINSIGIYSLIIVISTSLISNVIEINGTVSLKMLMQQNLMAINLMKQGHQTTIKVIRLHNPEDWKNKSIK